MILKPAALSSYEHLGGAAMLVITDY